MQTPLSKNHARRTSHDSRAGEGPGSSDASSSTTKKRSPGFLKLFAKKKVREESAAATPDDKSSASAAKTPMNAGNGEVEAPHMEGSRFQPLDICPSCDEPRGLREVCPVSRYHHGTDLPAAETAAPKKKKGVVAMGGLMNKLRRASRTPSDVVDSSTAEPTASKPSPKEKEKAKAKAKKEQRGDSHQADPTAEHATGENSKNGSGGAHTDMAPQGEAGADEAAVQYYVYTDEEGNTYYYAAPSTHDTPAPETDTEIASCSNGVTPIVHQQEPVCYQYTSEDGTVQYYYAYPESDQAQSSTPHAADDNNIHKADRENGKASPAGDHAPEDSKRNTRRGSKSTRLLHRGKGSHTTLDSRSASSSSSDTKASDTHAHKKEKRATKMRRDDEDARSSRKDKKEGKHKSAHKHPTHVAADEISSEASISGPSEDGSGTSECRQTREAGTAPRSGPVLDAAIAARARELERLHGADARKTFEKTLRKAVKELKEAEKSERNQLIRQRRTFTEDLGRQKRAVAFEMRDVERRVKRAVSKGEPQ